jgi:hypothetical protein
LLEGIREILMAEVNENNQPGGGDATPKLPQEFEIPVLPLQNTTLFPQTVVPHL